MATSFRTPIMTILTATAVLSLGACTDKRAEADAGEQGSADGGVFEDDGGDGFEAGDEEGDADGGTETSVGDDGAGTGGEKLDVGLTPDTPLCDGEECVICDLPEHTPCDSDPSDLANVIGLNCPGEPQFEVVYDGSPDGRGSLPSFGNTTAFAPREGANFVALGSGRVADLPVGVGGTCAGGTCCNSDLGAFDKGPTLPMPMNPVDVGAVNCIEDPTLLGEGDCSNTLQTQWNQGSGANDYSEMRITATAPDTASSFSYDLAFFSYEYPNFYQSSFNDMYIGWLESETWTGNISFDEMGNPISLNAGFLDYRDVPGGTGNDPECADGCTAQELHGTCMEGHAGTKWLTTTAGVNPSETFTLIFAVFDMSDSILDSYVFLDNFQWGCEGKEPPTTVPEG